ncbi:MAG: hypothetical protein U1E93_02965 [Alphaproteobacteria bacterium]
MHQRIAAQRRLHRARGVTAAATTTAAAALFTRTGGADQRASDRMSELSTGTGEVTFTRVDSVWDAP